MKYIISNKPFLNSKRVGNLFVTNSILYDENGFDFVEGFIDESTRDGMYNRLTYDIKKEKLQIENGKAGTFPLFYYAKNQNLIISNNIWDLVLLLPDEEVEIDAIELKFLMFQFGMNPTGKTFFKNIFELKPSFKLEIDLNSFTIKDKKTWHLESKNTITSTAAAVQSAEEALNKSFNYINSRKEDSDIFGFGNSGGFDSRLIPAFSEKLKLKLYGVTIVDKRPFRKSVTELNAQKISQLYNFPTQANYFKASNLFQNLNLDISNNPLGPCQILKNHYYHTDKEKYNKYISGGNGFIIGGRWNKYLSNTKAEFQKSFVFNYMNKLPSWEKSQLFFFFKDLINSQDLDYFLSLRNDFFKLNAHKSNIDIIRSFHLESINKHSHLGGYESQNGTIPTYNIYYPFLLPVSNEWDNRLLLDRTILKGLIKNKSLKLSQIPGQDLERIEQDQESIWEKVIKKVKLKFISPQGLSYHKWIKDPILIRFIKETLERPNVMWENLFSRTFFTKNLNACNVFVLVDILKAKRIVDIIYYKEYETLNIYKYTANEI